MPEPKQNLTKLAAGRHVLALFVSNRQTLWLSGDHLVLQITTGYTERVRRFYFADIQSISYARTGEGTAISIVCAATAALLVFLGFWNASELGLTGGLSIAALALLPLLGLGFNLIAGPTCACVFSTAVHTERVLALNRIAKVERVLGQILPRIDAAQGRLSADMLAADHSGTNSVEPGVHALEGNAGRVELRHEPGTFHRAAFVLCLVFAASYAIDIFVENRFNDAVIGNTLLVALGICALVALRRQGNSDLPVSVKNIPVVIVALLVGTLVCSASLCGYFMVVNPERALTGDGLYMMPRDSVATQIYLVGGAMAYALAGIVGLMRLGKSRTAFPVADRDPEAPVEARDDSP